MLSILKISNKIPALSIDIKDDFLATQQAPDILLRGTGLQDELLDNGTSMNKALLPAQKKAPVKKLI